MKKELGVYIHIPFCISKCHYCDFTSFSNNNECIIKNYIDALCNEILLSSEILSLSNIKSIYFGGGTPSYIDSKYIKQIIDTLKLVCNVTDNTSITIEINPKTLTLAKAREYVECNINRVSIGLQSTYNNILKAIGRVHTYEDFLNTLEILSKVNIKNISCDLIYPLPYLTTDMFKRTLETVVKLKDINHISIYNLEVHKGTKLAFLLSEGYLSLCSEDEEYIMRNMINEVLTSNKYINYEISNYAKKGYESVHNLLYWNQNEYLGFGVASSSFLNNTRTTKTNDLNVYINAFNNLDSSVNSNNSNNSYNCNTNNNNNSLNVIMKSNDLDINDLKSEYVILKLRLKDGINEDEYYTKFKSNITDDFKEAILDNIAKGLIIHDKVNNNIYLSARGKEVANIVWQSFI